MTGKRSSVSLSLDWWREYQDQLKGVIEPLSDDQLTMRLAPDQRSVGEIAAHIVVARAWYLRGVMGEGGPEINPLTGWDQPANRPNSAAELLVGLNQTWQLLTACVERWTETEMGDLFFLNWLGHEAPRSYIIWHILEHELHHGGELSLTLGAKGLTPLDI